MPGGVGEEESSNYIIGPAVELFSAGVNVQRRKRAAKGRTSRKREKRRDQRGVEGRTARKKVWTTAGSCVQRVNRVVKENSRELRESGK